MPAKISGLYSLALKGFWKFLTWDISIKQLWTMVMKILCSLKCLFSHVCSNKLSQCLKIYFIDDDLSILSTCLHLTVITYGRPSLRRGHYLLFHKMLLLLWNCMCMTMACLYAVCVKPFFVSVDWLRSLIKTFLHLKWTDCV